MFLLWTGALVVPWTRLFCLMVSQLLTNHLQWSGKICSSWILNVRHAGQSRLKELNDHMEHSHSGHQLLCLIEKFRVLLPLLNLWSLWREDNFLPARDRKILTVQGCILVMLEVFQEKTISLYSLCFIRMALDQRKDFPLQFLSELAGICQVSDYCFSNLLRNFFHFTSSWVQIHWKW